MYKSIDVQFAAELLFDHHSNECPLALLSCGTVQNVYVRRRIMAD